MLTLEPSLTVGLLPRFAIKAVDIVSVPNENAPHHESPSISFTRISPATRSCFARPR
jgi:hypothetical protein